jgi:transposase
MNIYELKSMSESDRNEFFETYSTEKKEQTYMKPLKKEELDIKHDELAQTAMKKAMLEEELREIKKEHKAQIDPVVKQFSNLLMEIKQRAVEITGPAHKIPDYDNQMMHFVAVDGTVINSRPMLPEERQFTIHSQFKQAQ